MAVTTTEVLQTGKPPHGKTSNDQQVVLPWLQVIHYTRLGGLDKII